MKSKKFISIFILFFSSVTFGQNYQTVSSNRISCFNSPNGDIKCIRIDSVKHQTDSILYPFSNFRESENYCYTPYGPSWIGDEIIIRNDGLNIFFNKNHDSILLKTNALLNESWTLFNVQDSMKIAATITKHDTMSFLGLFDSVKSVGFQVYDKNMNPLIYDLNNMELKISKNYGFVGTTNFYFFPDFQISYPFNEYKEYNLIGLSNPKTGVQNLTWLEANDFQIGDEIHVLNESRSIYGGDYDYIETTKSIYKYLNRFDYTDSIKYNVEVKQNIFKSWPPWIDIGTFEYKQDTISLLFKADSQFDKLPYEPVISDNGGYYYNMSTSYNLINGTVISKSDPRHYLSFSYSGDECWILPLIDDCNSQTYYLKGLGGPYYDCDFVFSLGGMERKLVYYKKGQIIWGSPLIITGINDERIDRKINLFPNPANDFITIQFEEFNQSAIFEIFDIKGKLLLTRTIDSNESTIGIMDLKAGLYLYRLRDNKMLYVIDKLIIR